MAGLILIHTAVDVLGFYLVRLKAKEVSEHSKKDQGPIVIASGNA